MPHYKLDNNIYLPHYKLEKLDIKNSQHVEFLIDFNQDLESSQYLGNLYRVFEEKNNPSYLCSLGNSKIAFIQVHPDNFTDRAELTYGLHPKFMHKHKGYATKLIQEMTDYLFKIGYKELVLRICFDNLESIRLALNCDFQLVNSYEYHEFVKKIR